MSLSPFYKAFYSFAGNMPQLLERLCQIGCERNDMNHSSGITRYIHDFSQ